jgi:hypothetical protein
MLETAFFCEVIITVIATPITTRILKKSTCQLQNILKIDINHLHICQSNYNYKKNTPPKQGPTKTREETKNNQNTFKKKNRRKSIINNKHTQNG